MHKILVLVFHIWCSGSTWESPDHIWQRLTFKINDGFFSYGILNKNWLFDGVKFWDYLFIRHTICPNMSDIFNLSDTSLWKHNVCLNVITCKTHFWQTQHLSECHKLSECKKMTLYLSECYKMSDTILFSSMFVQML